MRCIGQGLESLKTFCAVMSLPNPVEQKSYDVINNELSRVMKEITEESMKRAAVEENSSSPDNLLTVSGDGTWKTRGHSSLIGVCTVIGAETGDSETKTFNALSENKPYSDDHLIQKIECVGHVQKRMGTRLRKLNPPTGQHGFFRPTREASKMDHTEFFPDGHGYELVSSVRALVPQKFSVEEELMHVKHVEVKSPHVGVMWKFGRGVISSSRLTDSLIDKLAHYYGNAIRCNSTSVKEMRKAILAVWGHSCSTEDEPMHWFCPTNPNTRYLPHPALLKKCLRGKTQNPNESLNSLIWKFCPKTIGTSLQIAEIAANLATSVFNDGNQILITILEKFGLKINRNVCVSLAERDNRRIFTSRQRRLESSFEARRAKKIKKSKEIELFQEQEGISYDPGAF
ncbi:uncharacterized protein TNCV_2561101 [Trichonephila clavipes]|uniref:Mutator-like transposase domain-containing protein n=1 Tax=Trichonephila clavipes TaxID=2585209 RepID=A0A8X6R0P9_TRICX|nr:uncharacterized protein TNCV_2561101 [Trichonephila clavipes]